MVEGGGRAARRGRLSRVAPLVVVLDAMNEWEDSDLEGSRVPLGERMVCNRRWRIRAMLFG